jgi:hypothetical protein
LNGYVLVLTLPHEKFKFGTGNKPGKSVSCGKGGSEQRVGLKIAALLLVLEGQRGRVTNVFGLSHDFVSAAFML